MLTSVNFSVMRKTRTRPSGNRCLHDWQPSEHKPFKVQGLQLPGALRRLPESRRVKMRGLYHKPSGTSKGYLKFTMIPRGGFLCVTGFYPFIRFASCTRPLAKYRYRLADVMAPHWHYARRLNANTVMPNRSKNPDEGSGTAPEPTIMD